MNAKSNPFPRLALAALAALLLASPLAANDLTAAEQERVAAVLNAGRAVKIVGGEEAQVGEYPWAASIAFPRGDGSLFSYCGGSLIAADWVLTAAHCQVRTSDKVILGRHDLTTAAGTVHGVTEFIPHAEYNADTSDNDIALIHLATPSTQTPIALIGADQLFGAAGNPFTIAGWGLLEEGGSASTVLMKVTVPILDNTVCQVKYAGTGVQITDNMLCAADPGKDSCQGDSGGPGMVLDTAGDLDRLAGVVSFGIGCARASFPGVYTRVANYLPWIEEKTGVGPPEECVCD